MEDRIVELERRSAYQEHTIAELNEVITEQQSRLEVLESKLSEIRDQIKSGTMVRDADDEEPPPHY